jgi:hypothetical protein
VAQNSLVAAAVWYVAPSWIRMRGWVVVASTVFKKAQ